MSTDCRGDFFCFFVGFLGFFLGFWVFLGVFWFLGVFLGFSFFGCLGTGMEEEGGAHLPPPFFWVLDEGGQKGG